ncbi:unnamed protein product [Vitrella brassicaformis CCMP3155]|uniref:Uncharacterized protein n=1 Tax=Vitrella brassicaformis (strain CCMP3155) TaxID=1169540 RepID=A0A0G4GEH1_VITBC|nr:unnamed protein product [Vitrella brassicaformis CCMP3155]|eukprot:CEM27753.1 unnamed protein product [Vitrella brassicaformis CCMP3155]
MLLVDADGGLRKGGGGGGGGGIYVISTGSDTGFLISAILVFAIILIVKYVMWHRPIWLANNRQKRIKPEPTATPPESGKWIGTYTENHQTFITTYMLTFEYDGTLSGEGSDADGAFRVEGFFNATTGEVSWGEKAINGNLHVDVTGRFDESWQSHIRGRYIANTGKRNTMTIRFQQAVPSVAPRTSPPVMTTITTGQGALLNGQPVTWTTPLLVRS